MSSILPCPLVDLPNMLRFVVVASLAYTSYGILYRLCFNPVAGFPGPWIAAMTFWYEFYYDIVKRGQYTFKIRELHTKYVKLNP